MVEGRWNQLGSLIDDAKRQGFYEESLALDELVLVRMKVEDDRTVNMFCEVLSKGKITGR